MEKIGQLLKEKRVSKRLSTGEVNAATRIPIKYIDAIEEDDVRAFPAEVYYLGSLRRYALYLGFDDNEIVKSYQQEKINKEKPACPPEDEKCQKPYAKYWKVALVAALVIALGVYAWLRLDTQKYSPPEGQPAAVQPAKQEAAAKEQPRAPVKEASKPVQKESKAQAAVPQKEAAVEQVHPVPAPAAKPSIPFTQKKLKLQIDAVEASWIKVTSDGAVEYSAILEKGQKMEWFAEDKFELVVGYAPGVRVKLNGRDVDVVKPAKQDISAVTLTEKDAR